MNAGIGQVQTQVQSLSVEAASLNKQVADLTVKQKELSDREFWINVFSWIPIIKAIDELVSVIQTGGKSTEAALQEATSNLRNSAARLGSANATLQNCRLLTTGLEPLGDNVQALVNAITTITGDFDGVVRATVSNTSFSVRVNLLTTKLVRLTDTWL
ncbi:hypothetical protein ACGFX8_36190 [Streptomyces sp. NPDC048362]|uniref:hypothetical protein n=1 Tax=Streptomyces sp. NPDC048362 TaxID=3365539 RepID=UPI00371DD54A